MGYTDLTSQWEYKDNIEWVNMDAHSENSAKVYLKLNNQSFHAYGGSQTLNDSTWEKLTTTTEHFDTAGTYDLDNERWTPGVAGKYFIGGIFSVNTTQIYDEIRIALYKNGVLFKKGVINHDADVTASEYSSAMVLSFIDVSTTDYFELFGYVERHAGAASTYGRWAVNFWGSRLYN